MPEPASEEVATRDSFQWLPPGPMQPVAYHASFSPAEYARIQRGLIPEEMEDKWFIFWEDDILYLHRSWTGYCVYVVNFQPVPAGYEVSEAFVAAARLQGRGAADCEPRLLDFLMRGLLLHEPLPFPDPAWVGRWGRQHWQYLVVGNPPTPPPGETAGLLTRTWRTIERWFARAAP